MFRCPHCETKLIAEKSNHSRHFSCPNGHGLFKTVKECSKVFGPRISRYLIENKDIQNSEDGRNCPSCFRNTQIIDIEKENKPVQLSRCQRCRLIWFDKDEWYELRTKFKFLNKVSRAEENKPKPFSIYSLGSEVLPVEEIEKRYHASRLGMAYPTTGIEGKDFSKRMGMGAFSILSLIIIMGFLTLMGEAGEKVSNALTFYPHAPFRLGGLTMISYFFIHGSWGHLFGNSLFFFLTAPDVEEGMGTQNFLIFLATGTIFSLVGHMFFHRSGVGIVGASGGISSMILYYTIRFPHHKITHVVGHAFKLKVSVVWYGVFYVGMNLLNALTNPGAGVSFGAHLGGAISGILFALL